MPARKNTSTETTSSEVLKVQSETVHCFVVGTSPIILNRMSEKAARELLMPKGRKTQIEKQLSLKHNPVDEYRASAYTLRKDAKAPTYLAILSTAFKKSICTAALDMPGTKKAQIGRLAHVDGDFVGIYGVPKLFMSVVRSADMNRTPDIRTRAIVPEWAAHVRITYTKPLINHQAVVNLLSAAGLTAGVGDWRPEKGAGRYGQFEVVNPDHPEYVRIVEAGGRQAQIEALNNPVCYDDESTDLLSWFDEELARRQREGRMAKIEKREDIEEVA